MTEQAHSTTEPVTRHTKRVRFARPGEIGITLGGVEYTMELWEAQMLASMIDDVSDDPKMDAHHGR